MEAREILFSQMELLKVKDNLSLDSQKLSFGKE
jgi:hypothetical protein